MSSLAAQYLELTKPKVVALIVFTAVVGMFLATPGMVDPLILLTGTIGIGLAAGSAAAINHLLDQRADAKMVRTRNRPLATGRLKSRQVLIFALLIGTVGLGLLWFLVNPLTSVLTLFALIGYAVIYTVFLKRATPQNIVIGGFAGAVPPLLGWTAVTGQIEPYAWLPVLIIFVWTPPHFWALALYRKHDYAAVDIPMLPVTHGEGFTRLHILLYTILLLIVTLLPYLVGMSGLFYLSGAVVLGLGFLYYAYRLYKSDDLEIAMATFKYSVWYLMAIFAFLLIDHYLPTPHPLYTT